MGTAVGRPRYGCCVRARSSLRFGPLDVVLAVACVPPTIGGAVSRGAFGLVEVAVIAMTLAAVLFRRRAPMAWLIAVVVALLASVAITERPNGLFPAVVVLVFTVALRSERRASVYAGLIGMAGFVGVIVTLGAHGLVGPEVLAAVAWPALAAAAGQVVRSRQLAIAAAEERARRAEETREQEALRRVAEERLHIARELHDVVAHRMAVVNVQAGVAEHLLRSQPDAAAEALRVVRSSAQTALDELAGILDVLRTGPDRGAPVEPTPTLAGVGALVASFRDAGLQVEWETSGVPRPLGEGAELALYRTVQEALTNAHKHGDGWARVSVTHTDGGVDVEVVNRGAVDRSATAPSGGHGLVGMRERIHAAGGSLHAGPDRHGSFVVHAHVPRPRTEPVS
jgi:signal transduction histidine kinase